MAADLVQPVECLDIPTYLLVPQSLCTTARQLLIKLSTRVPYDLVFPHLGVYFPSGNGNVFPHQDRNGTTHCSCICNHREPETP